MSKVKDFFDKLEKERKIVMLESLKSKIEVFKLNRNAARLARNEAFLRRQTTNYIIFNSKVKVYDFVIEELDKLVKDEELIRHLKDL